MKVNCKIAAQTSERSQYLVRDYNDVTVRYILRYPGVVDREILSKAVGAVVDAVDVLHGSLHLENKKLVWKIWEDLPERAYFRHLVTENVELAAVEASLEGIEFESTAKLHCTLVQNHRESAVVLRMSHLVCDGGDSKYLLNKVVEAYNLILKTGTVDGFHVKNGSRDPAQVYAHLSQKEQKKLWRNPMAGAKNEFPFTDAAPGEAMVLRRVIGRDVMEKARERGKVYGATANDLILTGCYRAFAATPGVDQKEGLCVAAMMDLRRHCPNGDSTGLTNLAGALRTGLPEGVQGDFDETLKTITEQTERDKADPYAGLVGVPLMHWLVGKLPISMLLKAADMVYGSMALGLTNLGNLNGEAMVLGDWKPVDALFGGPSKKKPGVQISVLSLDGACSLAMVGEYTHRDVPELTAFLDRIVQEMENYAAGA